MGGLYQQHLDAFIDTDKFQAQHSLDGNRIATLLVLIEAPIRGGGTVFTKLNLNIKPRSRDAIFWYNLLPDSKINYDSLHGGCPILLGSKWLQTYFACSIFSI